MQIKNTIFQLLSLPFLCLIKCYQLLISPLLGQNCRFYPSCSHYAQQALRTHGPIYGMWLSLKRISKCHPLHEGGIDLVPVKPVHYKKFYPLDLKKSDLVLSRKKVTNFYKINDN